MLIDLYSQNYKIYFEKLHFNVEAIEDLNEEELDKLTKLATVIEYVVNRQPGAKLYDWIYSDKLKLEDPYTPGVEYSDLGRVKRMISAPKEFSTRNVFYEEETLKPI